jgi:adenine deaminase
VAENGVSKERHRHVLPSGSLKSRPLEVNDFRIPKQKGDLRVLVVEDGSLITQEVFLPPLFDTQDHLSAQPGKDILWMVLVNRYRPQKPVLGMVRGFGLDEGAIASSYAHDAHHVVAVGVDPESIVRAVNALLEKGGGLSRVSGDRLDVLPLPIAGLMSTEPAAAVANHYQHLNEEAQFMGSTLRAPYMQLAFIALPVIGDLKITSEGLFNIKTQRLVGLF